MPVRRRLDKHRAELPAGAIDWLRGGKGGVWFYFFRGELGEIWHEHEEAIVAEHVTAAPGSRPALWWQYSAPRAQPGDYHCTTGFRPELPSPRLRLGGIGTPAFEVLANAPAFWLGVPLTWVTFWQVAYYGCQAVGQGKRIPYHRKAPFHGVPIDRADPPLFESEAAYLERHGLLLAGERRRLKPRDFAPESILDLIDFSENELETVR